MMKKDFKIRITHNCLFGSSMEFQEMGDSPATFLECSPNFPSPSYLIFNIHLYHVYHIHVYHPYFIYIKSHNGCCISSRIFENIPQNGPEFSHRILAIARFLVTAVRKKHGGLAVLVGLSVKLSP